MMWHREACTRTKLITCMECNGHRHMTVFPFGIIKNVKNIVSRKRNEILNQRYLICLIIVLFFITIKDHGYLHGACGDNRSSISSLQTQGEWFIYTQNVTF